MPKIEKVLTLEITPEQYLRNCSELEKQELALLLYNQPVNINEIEVVEPILLSDNNENVLDKAIKQLGEMFDAEHKLQLSINDKQNPGYYLHMGKAGGLGEAIDLLKTLKNK